MEITFGSAKLKKLFEDGKALRIACGPTRAKKIGMRMLQFESAERLEQLRGQPGRFHELRGDRKGQLACDLDQPWRLIFTPENDPAPVRPDGSLDWAAVTRVCIREVVDYHD